MIIGGARVPETGESELISEVSAPGLLLDR